VIEAGTGADTITASNGADTIEGGGGGDSINVLGHTVADTFLYSAVSDSLNTTAGHDTIVGLLTGGSSHDLLDFSAINSALSVNGQVSGGSVAADSIEWAYSGGNAMVYLNDSAGALSTTSSSLMEVTLVGVTSGLSSAVFKA